VSKQDYQTPASFIEAVERRYGKLTFDLAATAENTQAPVFLSKEEDSLTRDWNAIASSYPGVFWLNPEFAGVEPWFEKASQALERGLDGSLLAVLSLASVGSAWFARHVHLRARVVALRGRLTFVGEPQPFNRDLMLSVYGLRPGFEVWDWRTPKEKDPCQPRPKRTGVRAAAAHSPIPTSLPTLSLSPSAPSSVHESTTASLVQESLSATRP
jgi:phage N-6-adenine-methyltransferase